MKRLALPLTVLVALLAPALAGCPTQRPAREAEEFEDPGAVQDTEAERAVTMRQQGKDAAEISRSPGPAKGVVVLWPRVSPRTKDPRDSEIAGRVQARLAAVAKLAAGDRPVDVRPEPERVCPQAGCAGASVGAIVTRRGDACAVVAMVSGPGTSPARLMPWAGRMDLKNEVVPFREPPESRIRVTDYASCDKLAESLAEREGEIAEHLKGLLAAE